MDKEIMINQQDLIDWIDRSPSNDDLDLIGLDSWEDIQDECKKYNIILSDLIVEDE